MWITPHSLPRPRINQGLPPIRWVPQKLPLPPFPLSVILSLIFFTFFLHLEQRDRGWLLLRFHALTWCNTGQLQMTTMVILFVYKSSYSVLHQVIALNQPQYILFPHTGDRFHDFEPIATSLFLERSDSVAHSQVVREACWGFFITFSSCRPCFDGQHRQRE